MISAWVGNLKVVFIAAAVEDPKYNSWPANWRELILRRIFHDPDPATGVDRSLRTYIATVSSGKARFDADLRGPVTVPGCGAGPAIQAVPGANLYDVGCVVFPGGSHDCGGMAILKHGTAFSFDPPRSPNRLFGWCRFRIDESLGVWAMEFLHAATGFDDLYKTTPHPGNFDEMACACGTHPSSFTKAKLGWGSTVQALNVEEESVTLHAVSLPQPPPQGRVTGLRIPTARLSRYFLAEARLKTDPFERGASGVSAGIRSEGVVVYEVDESVWAPMKLRTPTALQVGQSYTNDADQISVSVRRAVPGGFTVEVVACEAIRREIELARAEIEGLQRDLAMGREPKSEVIAEIRDQQAKIARLRARAARLGCELPAVRIESYGADTSHLDLPRGRTEPKGVEPSPGEESAGDDVERGEGAPAHEALRSVDLS